MIVTGEHDGVLDVMLVLLDDEVVIEELYEDKLVVEGMELVELLVVEVKDEE